MRSAFRVAKEYAGLKIGADASPLKAASRQRKLRQIREGGDDLPRRDATISGFRYWLASRRHRSRNKDIETITVRRRRWWRT